MAKNTRKVTHYEVYTVRRSYTTKRGLSRMEELAIFDDKALAEAYIKARKASPRKEKDVKSESIEIQATWVELEPKADNYSLPFNSRYSADEEAEEETPATSLKNKIIRTKAK